MDSLAHNRENSLFSEIFAYNIWLQAAIFKALRVFGQALLRNRYPFDYGKNLKHWIISQKIHNDFDVSSLPDKYPQ